MTRKAIPTLLFFSALLHLYIGLRLQPDLAFNGGAQWGLTLWLVASTLSSRLLSGFALAPAWPVRHAHSCW